MWLFKNLKNTHIEIHQKRLNNKRSYLHLGGGGAGIYKKRKSHSHFYSGSNNEYSHIIEYFDIYKFNNYFLIVFTKMRVRRPTIKYSLRIKPILIHYVAWRMKLWNGLISSEVEEIWSWNTKYSFLQEKIKQNDVYNICRGFIHLRHCKPDMSPSRADRRQKLPPRSETQKKSGTCLTLFC